MANGIIKKAFDMTDIITTPEMIESVTFGLGSDQYARLNRLAALNINLTSAAQTEFGYTRFQICFYKTSIVMYGTKADGSFTTFGTIT